MSIVSVRESFEAMAADAWQALHVEVETHPYHVTLEIFFGVFVLYMLFLTPKKKPHEKSKLSKKEEQEILDEFSSQPFEVPEEFDEDAFTLPAMDKFQGVTATDEHGNDYTNFASFDFLSYATRPETIEAAQRTVVEYGCGSCGPRGFYGTLKPHSDLEADLAQHFSTDAAIIYSFSYATASTLIPCFSARGDEILVDEACSNVIEHGCLLSRSVVTKYRHNDMRHLEELMAASQAAQKRKGSGIPRRWIVTEGLFRNNGHIAMLPEIMALKRKFRFRLVLEDSFGFATLGATGRGTPEHCGVQLDNEDIYIGAMSTALGSVGGFCVGCHNVVNHQRLAATGYVFSAALPPYASVAASLALQDLVDSGADRSLRLQERATALRKLFADQPNLLPKDVVLLQGGPAAQRSPLVHFAVREEAPEASSVAARKAAAARLARVSEALLGEGLLVVASAYGDAR